MNRIEHLIEPRRLFLAWQRPMAGTERRSRRIVGEIERTSAGALFRYLPAKPDFTKAAGEGFQGFPAFAMSHKSADFSSGVLDAFVRRLPPRNRDDFANYLARFRLPADFRGSDMALLGYTGAKLPGDGFELIPDLEGAAPPLELVMEVAGFRHQEVNTNAIAVGDSVTLELEPDNPADPCAIAIMHSAGRIGYVPGPYCTAFGGWLGRYSVRAVIDRVNGKPDRPLVFLFVAVS